MIVYLVRDIPAFVMYCVNGESGSSLLIESTDSMIERGLGLDLPGVQCAQVWPPSLVFHYPVIIIFHFLLPILFQCPYFPD